VSRIRPKTGHSSEKAPSVIISGVVNTGVVKIDKYGNFLQVKSNFQLVAITFVTPNTDCYRTFPLNDSHKFS